jgi:hypothetical protein
MTETIKNEIREFFAQYEKRFEEGLAGKPDIEATCSAFASCFIEANPLGVTCGENDRSFRTIVPQGYQYYRNIGTKSMQIVSLDSAKLDPYHYSTKAHWKAVYQKKDKSELEIEFDVIYFLQYIGNALKIFAYITGDEQIILREHGLIP